MFLLRSNSNATLPGSEKPGNPIESRGDESARRNGNEPCRDDIARDTPAHCAGATRYAGAANSSTTRGALSLYGGSPNVALANAAGAGALPTTDTATFLSMFPDARGSAQAATAVASADSTTTSRPADPMFRSLFQVDGQSNQTQSTQTVSPAVRELWGRSSTASTATSQTTGSNPRRLDLFSDPNGTFSG